MGNARHDGLCWIILCAILDFGRRDVPLAIVYVYAYIYENHALDLACFFSSTDRARSQMLIYDVDHINLFLL